VRYRVLDNSTVVEARDSGSLADQNRGEEVEKSKSNRKEATAADAEEHSNGNRRNQQSIRHHRRHTSRE
jgi:hypothetical protein